ncbi:MAG: 16S rRNA (cytidine(1402)-2'-O)-methyltransferase [Deltaproteobacteria bacterium]|nr:16S rRNA (cytidine(1402)-2'-O)-methyltransferase [Deltaproteobacteria bacterium]
MPPGILYIVATPIGNLEDITFRAVRILKEVDCIAAEDTRRTRGLLTRYDIHTPLTSLHAHNEATKGEALIRLVQGGKRVAYVTDAGTPGIADPGTTIVQAARAAGLPVVPIPGPCAFVAAASASGFPTSRLHFVGFLPEKKGRRQTVLEQLAHGSATIVCYVAKWDAARYLAECAAVFGERRAMICRELTKVHEEFREGTLPQLSGWIEREGARGEFVLLISGKE